jgi:hypothetical protein
MIATSRVKGQGSRVKDESVKRAWTASGRLKHSEDSNYMEDENSQGRPWMSQAEDAVVAEALEERVRLNLEMTLVASSYEDGWLTRQSSIRMTEDPQ